MSRPLSLPPLSSLSPIQNLGLVTKPGRNRFAQHGWSQRPICPLVPCSGVRPPPGQRLTSPATLLSTSVLCSYCTSVHTPVYLISQCVTLSMPRACHPVIPPLLSGPVVGFPCPLLHYTPCITTRYTLVTMQYTTHNSPVHSAMLPFHNTISTSCLSYEQSHTSSRSTGIGNDWQCPFLAHTSQSCCLLVHHHVGHSNYRYSHYSCWWHSSSLLHTAVRATHPLGDSQALTKKGKSEVRLSTLRCTLLLT